MDFSPSPRAADLTERVRTFLETEIDPVEGQYHRETQDGGCTRHEGGLQ